MNVNIKNYKIYKKNNKILSYSSYNFIFLLLNQFKVKMNITFFIQNDILNIIIIS